MNKKLVAIVASILFIAAAASASAQNTDTKIVGSATPIRLVMEGYDDFNGVLKRNEEANVGAIIGGVFLLFPFLWTMDYKSAHTYELIPQNR